ncbi:MAG: MarR family [Myxococcaceae bacterium]|nr:MarR family [Myxococcaceae bacterium]
MNDEIAKYLEERMALRRAWVQTRKLALAVTVPCGLTPSRYEVLDALEDPEERIDTQSALQKRLGVKASSVSRLVGDLVKLGLVARVRDRADRRQTRLATTEEGRARYVKAKKGFESTDFDGACGLVLAALSGLPVSGPRLEQTSRPIVHRPLFGGRPVASPLS